MATADRNGKAFPKIKNDLILRTARGEKTECVPVWIMHQTGNYLPEFKEELRKYDLSEIFLNPELVCKLTLQPVYRFDLDAVIIFSDILSLPQAFGMEIETVDGKGPIFLDPLKEPRDLNYLFLDVNIKDGLSHVLDSITLTRHSLNGKIPLIGFSLGPWTLMSYMIEGELSPSCWPEFSKAKSWIYKYALESDLLLKQLTKIITQFLIEQVLSGAQLLQIFEYNAGLLPPDIMNKFLMPCLKEIAENVKTFLRKKNINVPLIIFAKNIHHSLEELSKCEFDIINIDWTIKAMKARHLVGSEIILQGNLDPSALYAPENDLKKNVRKMIKRFGTRKYIANLGDVIYPNTPIESVSTFVNTVHYSSKIYNDSR